MPQMPKRVKFRKNQRGKVRGKATRGNFVAFGEFGLQSLDKGWLSAESIEAGRVTEVRYKVRGCAASIAAGSALTELMIGCDRAGLNAIRKQDVERAVGGLSNESKHAAALCQDALTAVVAKFSE